MQSPLVVTVTGDFVNFLQPGRASFNVSRGKNGDAGWVQDLQDSVIVIRKSIFVYPNPKFSNDYRNMSNLKTEIHTCKQPWAL